MRRRSVAASVGVASLLVQTLVLAQESAPPKAATDLTGAAIEQDLKLSFTGNVYDQIKTLVDAGEYNVAVALVRRPAAAVVQGALTHSKITEVYYILRGSGIQVTGGTLLESKPNSGSTTIGPGMSGSGVQGGRSSKLGPGDLQIIPPNVPHGFTSIEPGGIDYLVLRVDS